MPYFVYRAIHEAQMRLGTSPQQTRHCSDNSNKLTFEWLPYNRYYYWCIVTHFIHDVGASIEKIHWLGNGRTKSSSTLLKHVFAQPLMVKVTLYCRPGHCLGPLGTLQKEANIRCQLNCKFCAD